MSTLRIHANAAARVAGPGGSRPASAPYLGLWRLLGRFGRHPRAALRDATKEANRVRAMAQQIRLSDPRVAAELLAAADRHERLYG